MAIRDILQAAAGASGSATYVEDVFSTYLYTGNGASQRINNGIQLGDGAANGTIIQLTGDNLIDSSPIPYTMTNSGTSVSTSVKKYGTGSIEISNTNNYLYTSGNLNLGTSDFTAECWVKFASFTNWAGAPFTIGNSTWNAVNSLCPLFGSTMLQVSIDGNYYGTSIPNHGFTAGVWHHFCIQRSGNNWYFYRDGTQIGSTISNSASLSAAGFYINGNTGQGNLIPNSYVDDVRVCFGNKYALSGFTPPTSALPLDTLVTGKGGLVWTKCRSLAYLNGFTDTARGAGKVLFSSDTSAQATASAGKDLAAFNSTGFTLGADEQININTSGQTFVSWSFRKQPKFFDIVTYTGDGTSNRQIAHNLGSTPGAVIVKCTSLSGTSWRVYHRSLTAGYTLYLNLTSAQTLDSETVTAVSSTTFTVGTGGSGINGNGRTYVAYLFAHDAGGFGATGSDNVISCGSYTGNGSNTGPSINLGWEPQWILIKRINAANDWVLFDNMRGIVTNTTPTTYLQDLYLKPNAADADITGNTRLAVTSTGFYPEYTDPDTNANGSTYIYIAIRRPMKTPTVGTTVFKPETASNDTSYTSAGFPVDWMLEARRNGDVANTVSASRLTGGNLLVTSSTSAESNSLSSTTFTSSTGVKPGYFSTPPGGIIFWQFQRAPGFFDVVCYTGTGTNATRPHNLGVAPEMMIVKKRGGVANWAVYHSALSADGYVILNTTAASTTSSAFWQSTTPTATNFYTGTNGNVGDSGLTYVAYLFASCPGVSKVGSYTGNGTYQTINCGFTAGARFVMIKRTNSTGDWYVWDTARGIVVNNDPHLSLNSTAAEVTTDDSVDADSIGFSVTQASATNVNVNGASYIYLAIA